MYRKIRLHSPVAGSHLVRNLAFGVCDLEFRVSCFTFRVQCFGFSGVGCRISDFGLRDPSFGFQIQGSGFRVQSLEFIGWVHEHGASSRARVQLFPFMVPDDGVRVSGFGVVGWAQGLGWVQGRRSRVSGWQDKCKVSGFGVVGWVQGLISRVSVWQGGFRVSSFGVAGWVQGLRFRGGWVGTRARCGPSSTCAALQASPASRNPATTPECWRGQMHSTAPSKAISTFENHCLAEGLTFGSPLQGSCVGRATIRCSSNRPVFQSSFYYSCSAIGRNLVKLTAFVGGLTFKTDPS